MSEDVEHRVIAGIREILPVIAERAQEAEEQRRIPPESIKALQELGLFRLLQPKRFGGFEEDPNTFYSAIRLLASACGSTGWVGAVLGVHPWQLGLFDAKAQEEVWGADTDTRISSSYAPMGRATPVDGGFRFTGRWSFSSGCDYASWVFLGGLVLDESGSPTDFRTFLLPATDYAIDDVWDTIGLRGTGSNDIIVEDVFVPDYRTLSFVDTGKCRCPGQEVNPGPLYRLPFASVFSCSIAVPVVGMATGAYRAYVEHTRERVRASTRGKAADDTFNQLRIAEAASEIDTAMHGIERGIGEELELAHRAEKIPLPLRLRLRRDQVNATGAAIRAVDRLFESAGGRALKVGTPIQRFWRDAHAGRVHAINDPEKVLAMFGQHELGMPVQDAWL
ncbi:3-hydroxy-9,10-secoandrosta-1,3,5(10)-triene-9,17-dione monooxygenase [Tamaricihabitans halophyticus]|uniref:3-hydroxy-9,10-secoandrosta-1,3,5(10)-triene-9, 17-dione monooxygenase n=1 Tax=Tamaricihabitans halophyticus TaxID=1262583 RepID=A0A4R2Q910_9PSEU|nr:3-hydroxy-9,10-secoandrosta-1,3,5(10)-triene-9,17-dione monooxygenase oxygenase subunit [Tamaricihabitans halophyticus]TCP45362.1 3-hydroxy-9,10-secoandrosta-1,3,5(10)-triene-9,17-dione monooxygenase [Tamaricihabitans halophyticus]